MRTFMQQGRPPDNYDVQLELERIERLHPEVHRRYWEAKTQNDKLLKSFFDRKLDAVIRLKKKYTKIINTPITIEVENA